MKTLLKYLSFVLLVVSCFSCVDELDDVIYKGNVQFSLTTTADLTAEADDYTVKAKLYREYTGQSTILELDVDSIYEDGTIVTEAYEIEYGNWELQFVNLLNDDICEFCGIDIDDARAPQVDETSFLPIAQNVLENDTTVYTLQLVEFDDTEPVVEEEPPLTIAEFLALTDGQIATIQGSVTDVYTNASGKVSYLMLQDSDGDEIKVYGVYNISDVVYEIGDVLTVTGERTGTNGEDGLALSDSTEHSIIALAKANSIAAFLALADGVDGTIEAEVIEVSVNPDYGTVTYLVVRDSSGDELMTYGVWRISDEIYTVGQTLRITGERDNYAGEDQMSFSSGGNHSIEILSNGGNIPYISIAEFLALSDGTIGTIKGEVTEVSVNESYGTVTYFMLKDSNGDELKVYGVWKVSTEIYTVGQTLYVTGERDNYNGEDEVSLFADSGHAIIVAGADEGSANLITDFLALEDGVIGTIEGEVTEVSVNESYGTVTYFMLKDSNGDQLKVYGVWKISTTIYTVGQKLRVTGERDNYSGEDQLGLSSNSGHSIDVI